MQRAMRPGALTGRTRAPPSKSYTHRALVAGHLSGRAYSVVRPLDADDTRATARAIGALGTRVRFRRGTWDLDAPVTPRRSIPTIDCGESGTTLRFVSALAAAGDRPVVLVGAGRLPERPIGTLFDALRSLGADCRSPAAGSSLPARIVGPIRGGSVTLDATVSSQFTSALLLTLPTVEGNSELRLHGSIVSEPYIDATLAVLRHHRVRLVRRGRRFIIPGGQRYARRSMEVPGDASSAAYLWAAAALSGGRVEVLGMSPGWPQADLTILDLLERSGARVRRTADGATVEAGDRHPFSADLDAAPDLYPLAGVIAATVPGTSELRGAAHVAHKESDRRTGTVALARAMGATVRSSKNGLRIRGTDRPRSFRVRGLTDHRMVMSAAVGALAADGPCSIGDASAVSKSFPDFWERLDALREDRPR